MTKTNELYDLAEDRGYAVYDCRFDTGLKGVSVPLTGGGCAIGLNRANSQAEEREVLAHELGHCETWAFYEGDGTALQRGKLEARADRWAIEHLTPPEELRRALDEGCREPWELAERFGVTEEFIRRAWDHYTNICGMQLNEEEAGC